jgi:hypothetical protein
MTDQFSEPKIFSIAEMEDFFSGPDALTGTFSGGVANNACLPYDWIDFGKATGIYVTSITPPESGWPFALHCPLCKETVFILSPWAIKPEKGDYWRIEGTCGNEDDATRMKHDMQMSMPKIEFKPLDPPRPWPYGSFMEFTREMSIDEITKRWPDEMKEGKK